MRDNDGRKLDHTVLEAIRVRAVQQVQAGTRPDDVAAALGLNRSTVFAWLARYKDGGPDALRARSVPGRPSTLTPDQQSRLVTMVVDGDPRRLGFGSALWTRTLIRALIQREFAVTLSGATIGRLLQATGLSGGRATRATRIPVTPDGTAIPCELVDGTVGVATAVTRRGTRRFAAYAGGLTAAAFHDFVDRLRYDTASLHSPVPA